MLIGLALLILTLMVYASVTSQGFVYEDQSWLAHMQPTWHPMANISLWSFNLQTWLTAKAGAFHLINVALHLLNGLLVYALARRILRADAAAIAAFIFLLSPIQREAVNYVSGRPELISTALILMVAIASIVALHTHAPARVIWLGLMALCGLLAFTTKPSAIVGLPLALLTLAVLEDRWALVRACLWLMVGFLTLLLTTISPIALRSFMQPSGVALVEYAGRQSVAFWRLLSLVILPYGLSVDHDYAWVTLPIGLLALAALGWFMRWSWSQRVTRPSLAWAGLWMILAVLPRFLTLGIYPGAGPELNEHQFYVAMPGVSVFAATLIQGWL